MERTIYQKALEIAIMFAGALAGSLSFPAVPSVIGLSMALLFVSDRGQHRALADRFPRKPRAQLVAISLGAYMTLNMVALGGCYILGAMISRLFGV